MILRTWSITDLNDFFIQWHLHALLKRCRYSVQISPEWVLNTTQTGFLLEKNLGGETMGHCF